MVEHAPGVIEQDIAQHFGIAGRQRMVDSLAGEALRHPAFRRGAVDLRQFNRQLPLTALAQEAAKQRVIAEPFAGIIHPLQEQPLAFDLLQLHLAILFAGDAHD